MFKHTACPVCKQSNFTHLLDCKDYTVSQETFSIVSCSACDFKFTNPIPDTSRIGEYYKAESYISHSNTKKGLVARLYHAVRNYTLKTKLQILEKNVSRGTLLDFGCGTGMFLRTCTNAGWKVFGVEPDEGASLLASTGSTKVYPDIDQLLLNHPTVKFDAITLWHVLEHVPDLDKTLLAFQNMLTKDGVLIIAVPNHSSYDAKFYGEFWAAYDVPRHLYHFNPKTISALLSRFGFVLKKMLPMKFDSFYVSMLSEKYKTGRVNYFPAFWRGLVSNLKAKDPGDYSSVIYIFKRN